MPKNIPAESLPNEEEMAESFTEGLVERCKNMMDRYWHENPDLYALVQKKRKRRNLQHQRLIRLRNQPME